MLLLDAENSQGPLSGSVAYMILDPYGILCFHGLSEPGHTLTNIFFLLERAVDQRKRHPHLQPFECSTQSAKKTTDPG